MDCYSFPAGSQGTVIKDNGTGVLFLVRIDGAYNVWLNESQLRPLTVADRDNTTSKPCKRKVGDKVRIKSREWYEANKDGKGVVPGVCYFTPQMAILCGKTFTITVVCGDYYRLDGEARPYFFTEMMLEDDVPAPLGLIRKKRLLTHIKLD